MPAVPHSGDQPITAALLPTTATSEEIQRGWDAAFDLLVDCMAFAHIGLVVKPRDEVQHRRDLRILREAADASTAKAVPALDSPQPLGTHIELDDVQVRESLRRIGPHLLNARIYVEADRSLIQSSGIAASRPIIDLDDYGEVLRIEISPACVNRAPEDGWTSSALQVWLDSASGRI